MYVRCMQNNKLDLIQYFTPEHREVGYISVKGKRHKNETFF